jgi:hypothetical protein
MISRARLNARVLPDLVCPQQTISWPVSAFGNVAIYIGDGCVIPCMVTAF